MSYAVHETPTVLIDHEALAGMLAVAQKPGARLALIGFNEYSKHLLNLAGDSIVAIYDREPWKIGIRFRDKVVSAPDQTFDITDLVLCDYKSLYELLGVIDRLYEFKIPLYVPHRLEYKSTQDLVIADHDSIARDMIAKEAAAPISMMSREKILFLTELMRAALSNDGDLIEMGVYQGGSVWYLGQVLKALGESRTIDLVDVFEQHMMHINATMCRDEINRRLSDYPHCVLYEGLVDDPVILAKLDAKRYCFAHYDLGFHPKALEFLWDHLQPGSPLVLDNYGHIAAAPWRFDDFFAERGARVIRIPWSEQGLVYKTTPTASPGRLMRVVDHLMGRKPPNR
jgi:predicted O-methyltransferase YrrM